CHRAWVTSSWWTTSRNPPCGRCSPDPRRRFLTCLLCLPRAAFQLEDAVVDEFLGFLFQRRSQLCFPGTQTALRQICQDPRGVGRALLLLDQNLCQPQAHGNLALLEALQVVFEQRDGVTPALLAAQQLGELQQLL